MLKTILSVSGKPGLFKLISNGKNMVIVESLADRRRLPIHARDKVVSLGDIAMYTVDDEVPLIDILAIMQTKEGGNETSIKTTAKSDELRKYFAEILPNYDKDRVYDSDIKKLITWYNLLINTGLSFDKKEESEVLQEVQEPEIVKDEEAPKAVKEKKEKVAKDKPKTETKAKAKKTAK